MANASDNYGLILPVDGEFIEINDLNYNFEKIDNVMWDNRRISVAMYNTARTYNTGSLAGHEDDNGHIHAYRCLADNVTGTWDATKWTLTDLASEIEDIRENAGTDVEANPSGTATDTLEKLRVDSTIYAIPKDVVSKEAEGNPIEITDGASAPLVKCETAITGSQDLHGYDKPWVGGAGKNKLPNALLNDQSSITFEDVVMTVEGNGFHFQGTATNNGGRLNLTTKHITLPAGTYVFSYSRNIIDAFVESGNNIIASLSNPVFTLEESTEVYVGFNVVSERIYNETSLVQIESGSTPTTYAPYSNICPITAYDENTISVVGINEYGNGDKSFTQALQNIVLDRPLTPGTYTFSAVVVSSDTDNTDCLVQFMSGSNVAASGRIYRSVGGSRRSLTLTWNEGVVDKLNLYAAASYVNGAGDTASFSNIQIQTGSQATDYEEFRETTHTTTFPSAIYRGSEDVVNGEVTEEWGVVDLGLLEWSLGTTFYAPLPLSKIGPLSTIRGICSHYAWSTNTSATGNIDDKSFVLGDTYAYVYIKDTSYSDATTFKAAMSGVTLAYELATPTTSSVTSTNLPIKSLSGYTHIESSTGEMEIEYITSKYQPLVNLMKNMVVANPSEDATVTLEKLKVNDTVYSLPSGGGGGGESVRASNTITVSGGVS